MNLKHPRLLPPESMTFTLGTLGEHAQLGAGRRPVWRNLCRAGGGNPTGALWEWGPVTAECGRLPGYAIVWVNRSVCVPARHPPLYCSRTFVCWRCVVRILSGGFADRPPVYRAARAHSCHWSGRRDVVAWHGLCCRRYPICWDFLFCQLRYCSSG